MSDELDRVRDDEEEALSAPLEGSGDGGVDPPEAPPKPPEG
jgi:hypothetical protein